MVVELSTQLGKGWLHDTISSLVKNGRMTQCGGCRYYAPYLKIIA